MKSNGWSLEWEFFSVKSIWNQKIQLQKDFGSIVKKLAFLSVLLVVLGGGSNTSRWQDTWTNLLECSILNLVLTLWKMIQVTLDHPADCCPLKVSKFQKQILLFSFEPKTERNYFLISALRILNHNAYSQNNRCQKWAGMGLNGFIYEKIHEKKSLEPFGFTPNWYDKVPSFSCLTHY